MYTVCNREYAQYNQHIHSLQPAGPRLYPHGGRNDRGVTDGEKQAIEFYLQVESLSERCTTDGLIICTGFRAQPPNLTL
jgi:hypothetical protein